MVENPTINLWTDHLSKLKVVRAPNTSATKGREEDSEFLDATYFLLGHKCQTYFSFKISCKVVEMVSCKITSLDRAGTV